MEQERRLEPLRTSILLLMMEGNARVEAATSSAERVAVCDWVEDEIQ